MYFKDLDELGSDWKDLKGVARDQVWYLERISIACFYGTSLGLLPDSREQQSRTWLDIAERR